MQSYWQNNVKKKNGTDTMKMLNNRSEQRLFKIFKKEFFKLNCRFWI